MLAFNIKCLFRTLGAMISQLRSFATNNVGGSGPAAADPAPGSLAWHAHYVSTPATSTGALVFTIVACHGIDVAPSDPAGRRHEDKHRRVSSQQPAPAAVSSGRMRRSGQAPPPSTGGQAAGARTAGPRRRAAHPRRVRGARSSEVWTSTQAGSGLQTRAARLDGSARAA